MSTLLTTSLTPLSPPQDPFVATLSAQIKKSPLSQTLSSLLNLKFVAQFASQPQRTLAKRIRPFSQKLCLRFQASHTSSTIPTTSSPLTLPPTILTSLTSKWIEFKIDLHALQNQNHHLCVSLKLKGGFLSTSEYSTFRQHLLQIDHGFKPLREWVGKVIMDKAGVR